MSLKSDARPIRSAAGAQRRRVAFGLLAGVATLAGVPARSQAPARLRVKVFPGASNLALFAAQHKGWFTAQGIELDLQYTQNSTELRDGLAAGAFDIAHAAVDNAVAMREGGGHDIVIFMGADSSMNELFVQPDITAVEQLRGRTLIVDAPNTAFALQAKKILLKAGLKAGDYTVKPVGGTFQRVKAMLDDRSHAASTLNPPFSLQARDAGLRSLGWVVDLIGPYQGFGAFAMRAWARSSGDVLERYVMAYVRGLRWALARENRDEVIGLLQSRLTLARPLAEQTYAVLTDPRIGLAPDARFDREGFANVLALRAEIEGQWGGTPPPQDRYVDLGWYERALGRLAR